MTGIYFRIERAGKWESVELEDMVEDEIKAVMSDWNGARLVSVISVVLADFNHDQLIGMICQMVEVMREVDNGHR